MRLINKVLVLSSLVILLSCNNNKNSENTTSESEHATTGIKFFNGSFKEAKAKAKAENKIIFMDAYTSWCGPCKMMKQGTFPDPLVGKVFNDKFVSVAYDMEVGEGIDLAEKFQVQAYPTLLFLDADGNVISNELGYRDPAGLIALADKVIKK